MSRAAAWVAALALVASGAGAATVYRCGNAYSDLPCVDAQPLVVADAVTTTQRAEARQVAQGEKALAAEMARDRRLREAASKPALAGSLSAPPVAEKVAAAKKAPKPRKRRHATAADDDRDFIAAVPKARKTKS